MKNTTPLALLLMFTLFGGGSVLVSAADTNAPAQKRPLVIAQGITIPEFKLDGEKFRDAVLALAEAGKQHDPNHKGVNYLLSDDVEAKASQTITLDLKNVTLAEATEQLAQSAGVWAQAEDFAFLFRLKKDWRGVELVEGTPTQFDLGEGKYCKVVGQQVTNAIHLKWTILETNAEYKCYVIRSLGEMITLPGKQCEITFRDTMVDFIPTLKKP